MQHMLPDFDRAIERASGSICILIGKDQGRILEIEWNPVEEEDNRAKIFTFKDITDRASWERLELRSRNRLAEQIQINMTDFLARASHELRTPMNAIIGMTFLALQTKLSKQQRSYLENIDAAGRILVSLINNILDFSKIKVGSLELESTDFNLEKVIGDTRGLVGTRMFEKGVELVIRIDQNVPLWLNGDPLRISQILINLLANAAKFTDQGSVVLRVSTRPKPLQQKDQVNVLFTVQDTGIGMTDNQMQDVFEPYGQADRTISRRYGGTGLGLNICKQLLTLMGGSITVSSQLGKGSSFQIQIPLGLGSCPVEIAPLESRTQWRVLVADDNPETIQAITDPLKPLGWRCDAASSVAQVLELAQKASQQDDPYGLMLIDSDLDSKQMVSRLRSDQALCQPRIVLMTPFGQEATAVRDLAASVDDSLSKPILPSELLACLNNLLETEHQMPKRQSSDAPLTSRDWGLDGLRVLVVDDSPINRQVVSELLKMVYSQAFCCTNGIEALAWLEAHTPADQADPGLPCDVVLLDLNMPQMDGWECARRIRENSRWRQLPVLAMTAHAMEQERQRCLDLGMQDHISKPIQPVHFYEHLLHCSGRQMSSSVTDRQQQEQTRPAADVSSGHLPEIEGIDSTFGLRLLGGNRELYRSLLSMFCHTHHDSAQHLQDYVAQQDFKEAERLAHSIKGSAAQIGASALADRAGDLESALRNGWCSAAVEQPFSETLQLTLHNLHRALTS